MEFRKIDKNNYMECIFLKTTKEQENFVADNARSLVEANYEEGLFPLAIYHHDKMIGFLLYDYDNEIPGWSLSRFMIDFHFQGKGYGKQAAKEFLDYFKQQQPQADKIYISVELENAVAQKMYASLGFRELGNIEYVFDGVTYKEIRMVKNLQ